MKGKKITSPSCIVSQCKPGIALGTEISVKERDRPGLTNLSAKINMQLRGDTMK